VTSTKGLGLLAKKPATGYMRGNMLSRDLAFYNDRPIVLRMLNKAILTGSCRSPKITRDECHYLACMSLQSGGLEPILEKVSELRYSMMRWMPAINLQKVYQEFLT